MWWARYVLLVLMVTMVGNIRCKITVTLKMHPEEKASNEVISTVLHCKVDGIKKFDEETTRRWACNGKLIFDGEVKDEYQSCGTSATHFKLCVTLYKQMYSCNCAYGLEESEKTHFTKKNVHFRDVSLIEGPGPTVGSDEGYLAFKRGQNASCYMFDGDQKYDIPTVSNISKGTLTMSAKLVCCKGIDIVSCESGGIIQIISVTKQCQKHSGLKRCEAKSGSASNGSVSVTQSYNICLDIVFITLLFASLGTDH